MSKQMFPFCLRCTAPLGELDDGGRPSRGASSCSPLRALAALLLLLGCGEATLPASHPGASHGESSRVDPSPYRGDTLTCSLDGLSIPFYSSRDPRWGSPTAPVALVIFSDFECPYCAHFRRTLDAIKTRYGADKVQILWKNNPLVGHPSAKPAALVGQAVYESAGAEAFWRYHDLIFSHQKSLTPETPARWAAEAGVPGEQLRLALASPTVEAKVNEDLALAHAIGLQGTPMTILNGFLIEGAQDEEVLSSVIENELKVTGKGGAGHACRRMQAGRQAN